MILRKRELEEKNGRRPYPLDGRIIQTKHFVTRITTPDNPFLPHSHEQNELWFIIGGTGIVSLERVDHIVNEGDLIVIDPGVEHGLRTSSHITWICLG